MKKTLAVVVATLIITTLTGCTAEEPAYTHSTIYSANGTEILIDGDGKQVTNATIYSSTGTEILIDSQGAQITADLLLHATLNGKVYILRGADTSIAVGDSYEILIVTGASPMVIVELEAQTTGAALGYFYEDVLYSDNGTLLNAINLQRVIDGTSIHTLYGGDSNDSGLVITGTGTLLMSTAFAANAVKNINDSSGIGAPLMLKPNSYYLNRITNTGSQAMQVDMELIFLETGY